MSKDRQTIDREKTNGREAKAGDPEAKAAFNGRAGGGDSGGGAYPNPHSGKEGGKTGGLMGHGGQSEMAYHGHGQLGDQDVEGGNANAPAQTDYDEDKPER